VVACADACDQQAIGFQGTYSDDSFTVGGFGGELQEIGS
jgi:hypothetical protein